MKFNRGFNAEKFTKLFNMRNVMRTYNVFADEDPNGGGTNPTPNPSQSQTAPVNFDQLIAKAREEEKNKLYPTIEKLKTENATYIQTHNEDLIAIGTKDKEIEIIDCINLKIKTAEAHKQEYVNKQNNVTIHQKLDLIMKSLGGINVHADLLNGAVEKEESEDDYDYILEYDELIDDYKWCLSFFEGVNQIVDFCTNSWEDASNIRIVYFTC